MDIIKYYQQSLSSLTKSADENEKKKTKKKRKIDQICLRFIKKNLM